jgi:predicted RNA binding protein YcfA (HicA-like mRNA interferase family)
MFSFLKYCFSRTSRLPPMTCVVYTERPKGHHLISLRKAEKHEARYYRPVAKENLVQERHRASAQRLDSDVMRFRPSVNSGRPRYLLSFDHEVSEVLRLLQRDGWNLVATRGSHRQFKHASRPGRVTVPGKPSDDLAPGTLNSIFKQAGLK